MLHSPYYRGTEKAALDKDVWVHESLIASRSQQPALTAPPGRGSGLRGAAPVGGERADGAALLRGESGSAPSPHAVSRRPLVAARGSAVWRRPLAATHGAVPPLPAAPDARGFLRCIFFALLLLFSSRGKQED